MLRYTALPSKQSNKPPRSAQDHLLCCAILLLFILRTDSFFVGRCSTLLCCALLLLLMPWTHSFVVCYCSTLLCHTLLLLFMFRIDSFVVGFCSTFWIIVAINTTIVVNSPVCSGQQQEGYHSGRDQCSEPPSEGWYW